MTLDFTPMIVAQNASMQDVCDLVRYTVLYDDYGAEVRLPVVTSGIMCGFAYDRTYDKDSGAWLSTGNTAQLRLPIGTTVTNLTDVVIASGYTITPPAWVIYDNNDPIIGYDSNWYDMGGVPLAYNGTLKGNLSEPSFCFVVSDCLQFKIMYFAHPTWDPSLTTCLLEVYVDNILIDTINQFSTTFEWQKVWTSPILSPGNHVIILWATTEAAQYVTIDRIDLYKPGIITSGGKTWVVDGEPQFNNTYIKVALKEFNL